MRASLIAAKLGSVLLVVISLGLSLGFVEVTLRLLNIPRLNDHPFGPGDRREPELGWDSELGWALVANQGTKLPNACGEMVNIAPHPSRYLLRTAKGTTGPTILFIGDSFTHAYTVNTGEAFYDWVEKLLPFPTRIYAGGVAGYGNVQENLLIKKIMATTGLHPDLIVWQICGNDLINNVYELETHEPANNNGMPRPYYDPATKTITIRDPTITLRSYYLGETLSRFRLAVLALAAAIKVDLALGLGYFPNIFSGPISLPPEQLHAAEARGVAVTQAMVDDIAERLPDTILVGFGVGVNRELIAPIFNGPRRRWLDIPFAPDLCPPDTHWNDRGHEQVGQFLAARLLAIISADPELARQLPTPKN
jgi:hypothetical protein